MENSGQGQSVVTTSEDISACYLSETFFPMGFPVRVVTNRVELLEMARRSWSKFTQMSANKPLLIEIKFVEEEPIGAIESPDTYIDGDKLIVAFDRESFVVADLKQGFARGALNAMFLEAELHLRYYVLESIALSMISTLRAVALHGACVAWNDAGVLLCGESGAGKTTLAYACARVGWSYISDDASYLVLDGEENRVIGNCHQIRFREVAVEVFTELNGREKTLRVAGKPSIELDVKQLPGIRQEASADIQFILFLNRDVELAPGLYPIEKESVEEYFAKFFLMSAAPGSRTSKALERLLSVQMFELRYTDLDWAVRFLSRAIEEASRCRAR